MIKSFAFALVFSIGLAGSSFAGDTVGLELMKKSDCFTCHRVPVKLIGPAYKDVATKYKGADEAKIKELAHKVIVGGSGNWGAVPMKAHPELTEENAILMVKYVLSVNDAAAPAPTPVKPPVEAPVDAVKTDVTPIDSKKSDDSHQTTKASKDEQPVVVLKVKKLSPEPSFGRDLYAGLGLAVGAGILAFALLRK